MKKLSPMKRALSLAMLLLTIVMLLGMLSSVIYADDDTAAADTAGAKVATEKELEEAADAVEASVTRQQTGIMHTISIPFGYVVRGCSFISAGNYPIALLLYALAMKIILFPFGIKQQKNSIRQAKLRPKEQAIREKYAGRDDKATQQKIQQEIMELYRSENYNPMSGCLPLLLQLPILFALYRVVYNPLYHVVGLSTSTIATLGRKLVYMGKITAASRGDIDVLSALSKLSGAEYKTVTDGVTTVAQKSLPNISIFGINLADSPSELLSNGVFILLVLIVPILVFASTFLSMKLTRKFTYQPTTAGDAGKSLKIMDFIMPAFSTFLSFTFPLMLGLYWIYQSVLGVAQQFILSKMYPLPKFTEEDYAAARREILGKGDKKKKKKYDPDAGKHNPKSLHHIDDDDDDEELPARPSGDDDDEDDDEEDADPDRPATLLNGEKLPEQKGAVPPAALKEDVPAPEKKKGDK